MTEYITKEQAIDEVWDAFTSRDDPDLGRVIEENIERLPAADVVPVVHAQWEIPIFIDGNDALDPRVKCSECGEVEAALARWKYCPNCGARMDGGENYD